MYSSEDITFRGKKVILCGGSGLYIEAVTKGYELPDVPQNPKLREELEQRSTEDLIDLLKSMVKTHNSTDYDTRKRLIRALEIAFYKQEHPEDEGIYTLDESFPRFLPEEVQYIGTDVSREERVRRIDARLDARLKEGMLQEVQTLLDKGIPAEDLIYYGLEYKFVTLHLIGELTFDQMREQLAIAIHQFAKRQMTWFRGMERKGTKIEWVKP